MNIMSAAQVKKEMTAQESISKETLEQLTALVKEKYPEATPDSLEATLVILCPLAPDVFSSSATNSIPDSTFMQMMHDALLTIPK